GESCVLGGRRVGVGERYPAVLIDGQAREVAVSDRIRRVGDDPFLEQRRRPVQAPQLVPLHACDGGRSLRAADGVRRVDGVVEPVGGEVPRVIGGDEKGCARLRRVGRLRVGRDRHVTLLREDVGPEGIAPLPERDGRGGERGGRWIGGGYEVHAGRP